MHIFTKVLLTHVIIEDYPRCDILTLVWLSVEEHFKFHFIELAIFVDI